MHVVECFKQKVKTTKRNTTDLIDCQEMKMYLSNDLCLLESTWKKKKKFKEMQLNKSTMINFQLYSGDKFPKIIYN